MMTIETVLVTPDMAAAWLLRNPRNRPIKPAMVRRMAAKMAADQWIKGHPQGIVIDAQGSLADGQHRLSAVVAHGKPVWMTVVKGSNKDADPYLDSGTVRTKPEQIAIASGIKDVGLMQMVLRFTAGAYVLSLRGLPHSADDFAAIAIKYRNELDAGNALFQTGTKIRQVGVRTAVARAFAAGADSLRVTQFCMTLASGRYEDEVADSAALALRDHLLMSHSGGGASISYQVYLRTEGALYAFLKGVARGSSVAAKTNRELFQLPEDSDWVDAGVLARNQELVRNSSRSASRNGKYPDQASAS